MAELRYGRWSGNPEGFPRKPKFCIRAMFRNGSVIDTQCTQPAHYGPTGDLCVAHARDAGFDVTKKFEKEKHK